MSNIFTKDYHVNEMGYKSIGKIGRFEWLVKRTSKGYNICAINKFDEVEFGTTQSITDENLEVINLFKQQNND